VHEFGLAEGVLEAVQKRAAGRQVTGIRVRCGVRHAVEPESMAQAFGMVAAGTEADGAAVEVVTVPARVSCHGCGADSESSDALPVCPRCGSADVDMNGGDELTLESVRYASSDPVESSGLSRTDPWWLSRLPVSAGYLPGGPYLLGWGRWQDTFGLAPT
jgi:hydrogenase nickel incorporation protein HypA/HybF